MKANISNTEDSLPRHSWRQTAGIISGALLLIIVAFVAVVFVRTRLFNTGTNQRVIDITKPATAVNFAYSCATVINPAYIETDTDVKIVSY